MVVKTSGREAWTRRSDSKHQMGDAEVAEMAVNKGQVPFETEDCPLVYPQDFSVELIQKWATKVRAMMDSGHHLTDIEMMVYRRLGRMQAGEFVPNNACALIFAKDPRQLFPGCWIRIMRYNGDFEGVGDAYNVEKDIWIENGPIPQLIEDAEAAIKSQIRTFSPLGKDGRFEDAEEYPFEAWHEAIVNACVHRSYGDGLRNAPIFVRLFESRMEIESPGPFMPFVNAENVYERHDPRHPHLMQALFFSSLVRMNREGTKRMRDLMAKRGLPPPKFEQKEIGHSVVRVTLQNDIAHRRVWLDRDVSKLVTQTIAGAMSVNQKRIVNWLAASEGGQLTINGVVKSLKISWQTAQKTLYELCRVGILQHIRFRPLRKNERDPKAYFRLRSDEPLPEGAHLAEVPKAGSRKKPLRKK